MSEVFSTDDYAVLGDDNTSSPAFGGDTGASGAPFSYIGMVIMDTVSDTEEKVKAIYGQDTSWVQHSGYILRAGTDVTPNNNVKDGGSDDATLVKHKHTFTGTAVNTGTVSADHSHYSDLTAVSASYGAQHNSGSYAGRLKVNGGQQYTSGISANHTHSVTAKGTISEEGSAATNANLPSYKNVYTWERIG
jgi:hypothetical protein